MARARDRKVVRLNIRPVGGDGVERVRQDFAFTIGSRLAPR
jgi:hypothetical protein